MRFSATNFFLKKDDTACLQQMKNRYNLCRVRAMKSVTMRTYFPSNEEKNFFK